MQLQAAHLRKFWLHARRRCQWLWWCDVPVINVRLQIALREICATTAGAAITTATVRAHEDRAKAGLFDAQHLVAAARTTFDGLSASTLEAKDVFAGYHAAVDKDGFVALVAAMDHRIEHLFANEVHFVVPFKAQHGLRWSTRQCRKCGRFQLWYIRFHVNCKKPKLVALSSISG